MKYPSIWKTIILGINKSPSEARKAIKANGYRISDYADQILNNVKFSETETQIDLVIITVAELGLENGARRNEIYARAIEFGFGLCPTEVGPALRQQYPDQPYGESICVAMDPIAVSDGSNGLDGYLWVLEVACDSAGRWLDSGRRGYPVICWNADDRWVFVALRK